jgi:hypothetical protein
MGRAGVRTAGTRVNSWMKSMGGFLNCLFVGKWHVHCL